MENEKRTLGHGVVKPLNEDAKANIEKIFNERCFGGYVSKTDEVIDDEDVICFDFDEGEILTDELVEFTLLIAPFIDGGQFHLDTVAYDGDEAISCRKVFENDGWTDYQSNIVYGYESAKELNEILRSVPLEVLQEVVDIRAGMEF